MVHRSRKPLESTKYNKNVLDFRCRLIGTMDLSYLAAALPASRQELIWWSCFSVLTLLVFKILLRSDAEDAIEFSVPVPEACRPGWEGKQLDEPSIKVRHVNMVIDGRHLLIPVP